MPLINSRRLLATAASHHRAIGHFNVSGEPWLQAILASAQTTATPLIVATSDRVVDALGGFQYLHDLVVFLLAAKRVTVPVVLHLDHGLSLARAQAAIAAGYTSVMYDGSQLPLAENVATTAELVAFAHAHNVSVEAEVGQIGGKEDGVAQREQFATVASARAMAATGIDSLAAAVGTVHGDYRGEPHLAFDRLAAIRAETGLPLVLHGASGLSEALLQRAVATGIAKVNFNTELNRTWYTAVQAQFQQETYHNPVGALTAGQTAMQGVIDHCTALLGSQGHAAWAHDEGTPDPA